MPQAWDGSGHYALAHIYSETVFPDTFGWTGAYFAGVGLPNYYPPLFYWLVALLGHAVPFTFGAAFKLVLALPVVLPAALWLLAWRLSGKDRAAATCAALAAVPLLVDVRLTNSVGVMGLSYPSTFLLGLYTQALGFVLLAAWYFIYAAEGFARNVRRVAFASSLLALALLANFFSSNVAALLVLTTLTQDAARLLRAKAKAERRAERRVLLAHLLSPVACAGLILFWLAPLLGSYDYVVTRPERAALAELVPAPCGVWYALAAAGAMLWLKRSPARAARPFLAACALLAVAVFFADYFAPRWFPSHPPRLSATLNLLLAAPAGYALASALRLAWRLCFGRLRAVEGPAGEPVLEFARAATDVTWSRTSFSLTRRPRTTGAPSTLTSAGRATRRSRSSSAKRRPTSSSSTRSSTPSPRRRTPTASAPCWPTPPTSRTAPSPARSSAHASSARSISSLGLRGNVIDITPAGGEIVAASALLAAAFHPGWRRTDGAKVYAASSFFMLTFVRGPANLVFVRGVYERAALWASAGTLLLLLTLGLWEARALECLRPPLPSRQRVH